MIIWQDAAICEFFRAFGLDVAGKLGLIVQMNTPAVC